MKVKHRTILSYRIVLAAAYFPSGTPRAFPQVKKQVIIILGAPKGYNPTLVIHMGAGGAPKIIFRIFHFPEIMITL